MTVPPSNVDIFRHKPVHEVSALLPDEQGAVAACQALHSAGIDVAEVQILRGEEGARILDKHGTEHGYAARLVRVLQNLGIDENALDVYDEGLRKGRDADNHSVREGVCARGCAFAAPSWWPRDDLLG